MPPSPTRTEPPPGKLAAAVDLTTVLDRVLRFAHHHLPVGVEIGGSAPSHPQRLGLVAGELEVLLDDFCVAIGSGVRSGGGIRIDMYFAMGPTEPKRRILRFSVLGHGVANELTDAARAIVTQAAAVAERLGGAAEIQTSDADLRSVVMWLPILGPAE